VSDLEGEVEDELVEDDLEGPSDEILLDEDDLDEDDLGDVLVDEDALVDDAELVDDEELGEDDLPTVLPLDEVAIAEDGQGHVAVVATPAADGEDSLADDDDEELDDDDVEASLDVILKERLVVVEDEDEEEEEDDAADVDDRADGTGRVLPKQPGEFVCLSCFLVKNETQLADPKKMLCRDCV
jgi:hypothetical protein